MSLYVCVNESIKTQTNSSKLGLKHEIKRELPLSNHFMIIQRLDKDQTKIG